MNMSKFRDEESMSETQWVGVCVGGGGGGEGRGGEA